MDKIKKDHLNKRLMTVTASDTLSVEKREKGERLFGFLNSIDSELKNAIIGYRCIRGDIPVDMDEHDDLRWMEFKSTMDSLTEFGICFVDENNFFEQISDIDSEISHVFGEHDAWAVLTLLEVSDFEDFDEVYFEAFLNEDGEQLNEIGIDLVGVSDGWMVYTCKFNITNQHDEVSERLKYLQTVVEEMSEGCILGVGTLSIQTPERIESTIGGPFDRLVCAEDILDMRRDC